MIIAAINVAAAMKYSPPAKLPVLFLAHPIARGAMMPPTLAKQLIRAIAPAIAVRLRNAGGSAQNIGRPAPYPTVTIDTAISDQGELPYSPIPVSPAAAISKAMVRLARRLPTRSEYALQTSRPMIPNAAGPATVQPVARLLIPHCLMNCGRK